MVIIEDDDSEDDVVFIVAEGISSASPQKDTGNHLPSCATVKLFIDELKKTAILAEKKLENAAAKIAEYVEFCFKDVECLLKFLNILSNVNFYFGVSIIREACTAISCTDETKIKLQDQFQGQKKFIVFQMDILACTHILYQIGNLLVEVKNRLTNGEAIRVEFVSKSLMVNVYELAEKWKNAEKSFNFQQISMDFDRFLSLIGIINDLIVSLRCNVKEININSKEVTA